MQGWSFANRREVPYLASPSVVVPPSLLLPILTLPLVLTSSSDTRFVALAFAFAASFSFLLALTSALFPSTFACGFLQ